MIIARRYLISGRVQGVGFRPFVARLALELGVSGWVQNELGTVAIHAEGRADVLSRFRQALDERAPASARISKIVENATTPTSATDFQVMPSQESTRREIEIAPDRAVCPACTTEFSDHGDRHFGHALLGCADCGPRFTIQIAAPFDRERTTMSDFPICADCRHDYTTIANRRFHAESLSCPVCGPRLWIDGQNSNTSNDLEILAHAGRLIREGLILAVKGIGGFHLICDASSTAAVARLRSLKQRERKPFAVLFADRTHLEEYVDVSDRAWSVLSHSSAPIVPLPRVSGCKLAEEVAPGLKSVGVMLAYSLLHRGLLEASGVPLVATSGNATNEPMPIDNDDARIQLAPICDAILLHNRRIVRHADDSVVRIVSDRALPIRVGRGLAPVVLPVSTQLASLLGVGGHLKSAIAFSLQHEIVLCQHIGDLDTLTNRDRYRESARDAVGLFNLRLAAIVHDLHPDYATTRFAEEFDLPRFAIQHHHAHIASCMAEHGRSGPVLGIAWDGTGLGDDGSIWGGEFLVVDERGYERVGSLWPFGLPGGDNAAKSPKLCAAAVCHEAGIWPPPGIWTDREIRELGSILRTRRTAPVCTSAGRLFDAWSWLLGLIDETRFEAEAAIRFEEAADCAELGEFPAPIVQDEHGLWRIDWRPSIHDLLASRARETEVSKIAARLHNTLARACVELAQKIDTPTVALSGGCFQNRVLAERTETLLDQYHFEVLTHKRIPPGDGGLAVGQVWAAGLALRIGGTRPSF